MAETPLNLILSYFALELELSIHNCWPGSQTQPWTEFCSLLSLLWPPLSWQLASVEMVQWHSVNSDVSSKFQKKIE